MDAAVLLSLKSRDISFLSLQSRDILFLSLQSRDILFLSLQFRDSCVDKHETLTEQTQHVCSPVMY